MSNDIHNFYSRFSSYIDEIDRENKMLTNPRYRDEIAEIEANKPKNWSKERFEREKMKILGKATNDCSGVYMITNTQTKHIYIGSASDINNRWLIHILELNCGRHANKRLQYDWDNIGQSCFAFEIIWKAPQECDRNESYEMEQYYIDKHEPEYNIMKRVSLAKQNYNPKQVALEKKEKFKKYLEKKKKEGKELKNERQKLSAVKYCVKRSKDFGVKEIVKKEKYYLLIKKQIKVKLGISDFSINNIPVRPEKAKEMLIKLGDIFGYDCEFGQYGQFSAKKKEDTGTQTTH